MMKVLLTGAQGQVGQALTLTKPHDIELIACSHAEFDMTDFQHSAVTINRHRPHWIINAAAYTAVDRAETDRENCFKINAESVHHLADAASKQGARLLQLSTDYVFSGQEGEPYQPSSATHPLNVYGESKALAEKHVQDSLPDTGVILRTSWVYGEHGHNFVKTILRLLTEKAPLTIVSDQMGTPTWSVNLAKFIWQMIASSPKAGIYHFTDAGVASWYDFAVAIQEEALHSQLLHTGKPILPINSDEFVTPARRPAMGVLDKQTSWRACGWMPQHWRVALRDMLVLLSKGVK